MQATKRAGGSYYLDLFAGPGQCRMEDGVVLDGSPLIAARALPPFAGQVWVDTLPANAASLRAHREDFPDLQIHVFQADANAAIDDVLDMIPRTQPALAFLDPEGSELAWDTISRIAGHKRRGFPKVELFVLFPYNTGIVRLLPRDPSKLVHTDKLDRMLPSPAGWRAAYTRRNQVSAEAFRRLLLEEYVTGLRGLGYQYVPAPRLVRRLDGQALYFMVFATDHPAGLSIMSDALRRVEATPIQRSFLPYDQQY